MATTFGTLSQTSGPIVLSDIQCVGDERRLLECPNTALDFSGCSHTNDAGVTCLPGNNRVVVL